MNWKFHWVGLTSDRNTEKKNQWTWNMATETIQTEVHRGKKSGKLLTKSWWSIG